MRVWIKDDSIPGLAMSRSFGDKIASMVGVVALPGNSEYNRRNQRMEFYQRRQIYYNS
jgi:hypothetical protein